MGLEKIIGFLNKNLSYNGIKEISVENCCNKIIAENIFFDFNFIIYSNLVELEDDINYLLKILFSLPYTKISIIEKEISKILDFEYLYFVKDDLLKILDSDNQEEMLNELTNFLYSKEKFIEYEKKFFGKQFFKGNTMLDLIFFFKVYSYINSMLNSIHHVEFIKNVFVFFDGIPSYSKILEQKRRRTKNFLESTIRKDLFKKTFKNFKNDIYQDNNLIYNYFDWLNFKISLDKSFGPSSKIITDLELFLKLSNSKQILSNKINYNLNICSGKVMGESDFKIFKYIQKKKIKGDIFIHTCDSDFVHLVLVQQVYNILYQKKNNYNIIRYYSRDKTAVQFVDSLFIVKELIKIVKKNFNSNENKYYILLDFLGLCYLFGNDHLLNNDWFGSELSFEEILYSLKISYKDRGYMLNFDKSKNIILNWSIFLDFLKEIEKKNNSLKINLIKKHRTYDGIFNFLIRTDITYQEFKNEYIPNYFSYCGYLKSLQEDISEIELDKRYYWDAYFYDKLKVTENPFKSKIDEKKINTFNELLNKWLNFYKTEEETEYLKTITKNYELESNNYQNLYQYISDLSNKIGFEKYHIYFKNLEKYRNDEDNKTSIIENYLLVFYHLIKNFFINMIDYNPCNLIHYKYTTSPSLTSIINYLNQNDHKDISNKFDKIINEKYVKSKNYFDSISHHLFITPYLLNSFYKEKIENIDNIDYILDELNKIENLCISESNYNFNFKLIEPEIYLNKWKDIENNKANQSV